MRYEVIRGMGLKPLAYGFWDRREQPPEPVAAQSLPFAMAMIYPLYTHYLPLLYPLRFLCHQSSSIYPLLWWAYSALSATTWACPQFLTIIIRPTLLRKTSVMDSDSCYGLTAVCYRQSNSFPQFVEQLSIAPAWLSGCDISRFVNCANQIIYPDNRLISLLKYV